MQDMTDKKIADSALELAALDVLNSVEGVWAKDQKGRELMTRACRDADYIPRVKDAGTTKHKDGMIVQVMHNGILVKKGGYQSEWQAETIKALKGVHEPQEEKVFYETLKRLENDSVMMELGSWWSYYSLWFLKEIKESHAYCIEPDPQNLELGETNAKLNNFTVGKEIIFENAAVGSADGIIQNFRLESGAVVDMPIRSVDSLVQERSIKKLDILHLDIQGYELSALEGALETIKAGKVRFVFISTHHYAISGDPLLHLKCLEFITKNGGYIVAKHTIAESCSGDGLIVASFDERDKDFHVEVSLQPADDSLFRLPEEDVGILWDAHDRLTGVLRSERRSFATKFAELEKETVLKGEYIAHLENVINEITPLRRHIKRQVVSRLKGIHKKNIAFLKSRRTYNPLSPEIDCHDVEELLKIDKINFLRYNQSTHKTLALSLYLGFCRQAIHLAKELGRIRKS